MSGKAFNFKTLESFNGERVLVKLIVTGLEENVLRRFKQLVIAKHGTLRGWLGRELTKAMQLWIKNEEGKDFQ